MPETEETTDYLADPSDLALRVDLEPESDLIDQALRRLSARFRAAVHHHITLVEDDEIKLSGRGNTSLRLPAYPVVGPLTVTIGEHELTEGVDFQISRNAGVLRHRHRWPDGLDNITITYSHGHAEVPEDIADAVLEMAEFVISSTVGVETVATGSENVKFANSLINGGTLSSWDAAVANHRIGQGDRV